MTASGARGTSPAVARLAVCLTLAGVVAGACGGSQGRNQTPSPGPSTSGIGVTVAVASSELTLGPNRFLVAVTGDDGHTEITGARLHLRFFFIDPAAANRKTYKNEVDADPIEVSRPYSHRHADGSIVDHEPGPTNIHLANVAFDAAGEWIVEVRGDVEERPLGVLEAGFDVRGSDPFAAVGQTAPRSVQPVLRDVGDISEIDFSKTPNPALHELTVAEAVTSGRPTVIAFATEGVCAGRACGPMKETVDELWSEYAAQANFIHVEPYAKGASGGDTQLLGWISGEWGIQSAPWVFVVDGGGRISARFEVLAGRTEFEAALRSVLAPGA
jgi:hypothetical protein